MATPINTFKTVTTTLTTGSTTIYTTPPNTTTIILLAQISNVGSSATNVTASHYDGTSVTTELIKNFPVPAFDAVSVLTGKLVLQANQSFVANAGASNSLKLTMSLIETI
jgi:hypothetical protein